MQVESGGNAQAASPKGALGLMQIMPRTWVELSVRYDLGIDPFDPHDNITAGTAYLREMLDRFGSEGFLAAYNAGPKRYEQHLVTGRPLPDETQLYVAKLAPLIGNEQRERGTSGRRQSVEWHLAPMFVQRSVGSSSNALSTSTKRSVNRSKDRPKADAPALVPRARGLFVQPSDEVRPR
ncbi:lytic transglycosylase domain-containing protein [Bradyrhizobium sp. RDT10]